MNKSKIEWCDYTWNPVTGCYHDCGYCYAGRIANRFGRPQEAIMFEGVLDEEDKQFEVDERDSKYPYPFGFRPTFHKYRLDQPAKVKKPSKIFVSSMGDLFGEWVPDEWIEAVLDIVKKCPQHTFQFLTKNPDRYYNYFSVDLLNGGAPDNLWIGATADNANKAGCFSDNLCFMNANVRFLSLEPLLEDVADYIDYEGADWIIIGAQTGPRAIKPKKEWVQRIIDQCKKHKIPLFLKDNLGWPEKIQEWPEC